MKFQRTVGYVVVVLCFLSAGLVFYPFSQQLRDDFWETVYHTYNFPKLSSEEVLAQVAQANKRTISELPNLSADTVYENFKLVNLYGSVRGYGVPNSDLRVYAAINELGRLNVNSLDAMKDRLKIRNIVAERRKSDPAFVAIDTPVETIWHWDVWHQHAIRMLPFSIGFAILGLVGLLRLWGFAKLVYVAGCAMSFLLSTTGGAIAQTIKKAEGEKKKDKSEKVLQIDARASLFVLDGPLNPSAAVRATFTTRRVLVESVSIFNLRLRTFYNESGGGAWLYRGKMQIGPSMFVTNVKDGPTGLTLGAQVFRPMGKMFLAIPVMRYEEQITGPPQRAFDFIANPSISIRGRWSIAPEVSLYKPIGSGMKWAAGAALRYSPNKGRDNYESGAFGSSGGALFARPRITLTRPLTVN